MYTALGDSFTSLVLDWYATLRVTFILFLFFLRHTNTVIMITAVVMNTNSVPATPTPINSDTLLMALSSLLVVLKCVARVTTGSGVDGKLETRFGKNILT